MSQHGFFPLENIVHIDPDAFKMMMPEWPDYVARDRDSAGTMCHMESSFMVEAGAKGMLVFWKELGERCIATPQKIRDRKVNWHLLLLISKEHLRWAGAIVLDRQEVHLCFQTPKWLGPVGGPVGFAWICTKYGNKNIQWMEKNPEIIRQKICWKNQRVWFPMTVPKKTW